MAVRSAPVHVALCVCTFRRPAGLAQLLEALSTLDYEGRLSVVVVDNDPSGQALSVYEQKAATSRWPLLYDVETRRGPSFARNRAVQLALHQNPDFVAMLDDDEYPSRGWLRALLAAQERTNADVVGGPVLPAFREQPPSWIVKGRFFEKGTDLADGSPVVLSSSANFLATTRCFSYLLPTPFPEEYGYLSGSDTFFFLRLAARGFRMSWATRAVVFEDIPPERVNLRWLRKRKAWQGEARVRTQRTFKKGLLRRFDRGARTFVGCVVALGVFPLLLPSKVLRARALLRLAWVRGRLAGHFARLPRSPE